MAQALYDIKNELKNATEIIQRSAMNIQQTSNTAEEARAVANQDGNGESNAGYDKRDQEQKTPRALEQVHVSDERALLI